MSSAQRRSEYRISKGIVTHRFEQVEKIAEAVPLEVRTRVEGMKRRDERLMTLVYDATRMCRQLLLNARDVIDQAFPAVTTLGICSRWVAWRSVCDVIASTVTDDSRGSCAIEVAVSDSGDVDQVRFIVHVTVARRQRHLATAVDQDLLEQVTCVADALSET